jgi:hypothetical protein
MPRLAGLDDAAERGYQLGIEQSVGRRMVQQEQIDVIHLQAL